MANDYWVKRAEASIGRMESTVNGAVPELVQAFEDSRRLLTKEINAFYGRYAKNNAISLEQAAKALSPKEMFEFKGDLATYERLAKKSIGTFNLTVDNLSVKARITRLQALQMQIDNILGNMYSEQQKQIEGTATNIYNSEYYHQLFDIEQYTGFKFNFSKPAMSAVQKIIEQPIDGADISTRLWNQKADLHGKIGSTLVQMFQTGRPPQDFADQLQKQIGAVRVDKAGNVTGTGKKFEAYRLLYTESAHVTNQAQLQACDDDGIDEFEDIVTLDSHTCPECAYFDGKHYPVLKAIEGVNCPPWHPFCRCTTAPYIPELAGLSGTRAARGKNGESESVDDMSYVDWAKEHNVSD